MDRQRLARAKQDILILAPGPINRGVEVTPDVADGPQSAILEQVTNGVAVRMAVLWLIGMAERNPGARMKVATDGTSGRWSVVGGQCMALASPVDRAQKFT